MKDDLRVIAVWGFSVFTPVGLALLINAIGLVITELQSGLGIAAFASATSASYPSVFALVIGYLLTPIVFDNEIDV